MKYGICLPYMKPGITRDTFLQWMRAIDEGPFYSLSCGERITGYSYEMRIILGAAAAVTERVKINASLYVLPMHDAVWAAKEIATLDVISGGRMVVTVGVGGREVDYKAVNADFSNRFRRMDEQIQVMRDTWAQKPPFEGADPVGPEPVQQGGPQILAGVMGPKSFKRVAKWADGVYAFAMGGEKELIEHFLNSADAAWEEAGRDTKPYRLAGFWYSLADDAQARLQDYTYDYLKVLDENTARSVADSMTRHEPGAINESLDALEELGVEEVFLVPATADIEEVDRMAELIARRS